MREAKVNLATVGVFSWARLEPSEGVYDFGWLDHVMDLLHDNDIQVNLASNTSGDGAVTFPLRSAQRIAKEIEATIAELEKERAARREAPRAR